MTSAMRTRSSFGRNGRDLLAADLYGTVKIWDAPDDPDDHVLDADGQGEQPGRESRWAVDRRCREAEGNNAVGQYADRQALGREGPIRSVVRPFRAGQGR